MPGINWQFKFSEGNWHLTISSGKLGGDSQILKVLVVIDGLNFSGIKHHLPADQGKSSCYSAKPETQLRTGMVLQLCTLTNVAFSC